VTSDRQPVPAGNRWQSAEGAFNPSIRTGAWGTSRRRRRGSACGRRQTRHKVHGRRRRPREQARQKTNVRRTSATARGLVVDDRTDIRGERRSATTKPPNQGRSMSVCGSRPSKRSQPSAAAYQKPQVSGVTAVCGNPAAVRRRHYLGGTRVGLLFAGGEVRPTPTGDSSSVKMASTTTGGR